MSDGGDAHDGDDIIDVEHSTVISTVANQQQEQRTAFLPLPADVFGDAILSIFMGLNIRHKDDRHEEYVGLWVFTSIFLCTMNMCFQVGLSWLILTYAINEKSQMYDEASLQESWHKLMHPGTEPLDHDDKAMHLCRQNQVQFVPAYLLCVGLWYTRITVEVAQACWVTYVILKIPTLTRTAREPVAKCTDSESDTEISSLVDAGPRKDNRSEKESESLSETSVSKEVLAIRSTPTGEAYTVMHIPHWLRFVILIFAVLPKLFICIWIAHIGAKFLELTDEIGTLVLKVMSCVYFLSIDSVIYRSFVSQKKQHALSNTVIRYIMPDKRFDLRWSNWGSTWFRIAAVCSCACFTHFVEFGDLRRFRYACQVYAHRYPESYAQSLNG